MDDCMFSTFFIDDCPCSRRVLRRVLERNPVDGAAERIVLVGHDIQPDKAAIDRGFDVDTVTPVELKAKYGVESAPLLLVADSVGRILYSGGYTDRKQGYEVKDQRVIEGLVAGEQVESLPVYGCAVSSELQALVDPLRLKYSID